MVDAVESIKEKMVLACKVLQRQCMLDGYGHVSARLADDRILSTPHMPPGRLRRDLIIIGCRLGLQFNCSINAERGMPNELQDNRLPDNNDLLSPIHNR